MISPSSTKKSLLFSPTWAYYAAFIALGLITASLGPTLPGLAENTGTLLSEVSFLFLARGFGYLMGSFIGGRLYDRIPGHPVMIGALAMMGLLMALVPLLPLLWAVTALLWLIGIAEGMLDVGGNTLIVWVHGDKVGPFMNGLHFVFGIGAFLSPIIIAQAMLIGGGITWAYWILALLMCPALFWLLRLPSPTSQIVTQQEGGEQVNYLLIALIAAFFFFYAGAEVSLSGWLFTYAFEQGLADETMAAYLTSAFFGAFTVGRLFSIPIATRLTPRTILLVDLLGALIAMGLILLWASSVMILWIGTILMGFAVASIFPTMLSFAERNLTITGHTTSWFFVGASLGAMSFPWLIGQLFESIGPQVVMLTIFGSLLVTMGLFVLLMKVSGE